jgi:hypothetical protein
MCEKIFLSTRNSQTSVWKKILGLFVLEKNPCRPPPFDGLNTGGLTINMVRFIVIDCKLHRKQKEI